MIFRVTSWSIVACILALSACTVPRGTSTTCTTAFASSKTTPPGTARATATDPNDVVERAVAKLITEKRARNLRSGENGPVTIDYLLMSTGGQYGAFGSGFLAGWSQNTINRRPDFNVVTGASAGGVLAPLAFLGPGFDASLPFQSGMGLGDVARQKSGPEIVFSNAILDPAPYERLVRNTVSPQFVKALAAKSGETSSTFVGVVNLDGGQFEIIDLGRMAREERDPQGCIAEAILATSAIPLVFPPRHVNGNLFADAGLRDHLFLNAVREGIRRATARGATVRTNAYIVINGDFGRTDGKVTNSLPGIAARSMAIASDEGLRNSVMEVLRLAELTKWNIKAIAAPTIDPSVCPASGSGQAGIGQTMFDRCITKSLFDAGKAMGRGPDILWLTAAQLRALAAGQ
jgi:predicted acylesterase/phospholipase RssA